VNLSILKKGSHTLIKVYNGKLDALIAPDIKSELVVIVENGEKNILVDLFNCSFCDSSGMSALLLGNRLCNGVNGKFVLCRLSPGIKEMVDLLGFETLLKIVDTEEDAVKLFV